MDAMHLLVNMIKALWHARQVTAALFLDVEGTCYDPWTCRAPIFISLAPSFLINPSRPPFLLIPTNLYLFKALIR